MNNETIARTTDQQQQIAFPMTSEHELQRRKEETLQWISLSALAAFRDAWHH